MSDKKFTKLERDTLAARREGKRVEVSQQKAGDGKVPIVTLKEFAQEDGEPVPAAEGPLPPPSSAPAPTVIPRPPVAAASQAGGEVSDADLEGLKNSVFGPVEPTTAKGEGEEVKEEELFEQTQCVRCGWTLKNQELNQPTDEDKLEFMESILGGRRFVKTVSFLGGRLKATYRTVLVPEEDAITELLNSKMEKKNIQNEQEWLLAYNRARLVVMLQSLDLNGEVKKFEEVTALEAAMKEIPAGWPMTTHGIIVQGMMSVNETYGVLMSRAYDPNFWEGQVEESD